jgi:enoyl-CoA hydratase
MIDADKAVEIGLANLMVKHEEILKQSIEIAKKIATKAPLAVKAALSAVKYGLETDLETGLVLEAALGNVTIASEDKNEGIAAFFEKRKPNYKGE